MNPIEFSVASALFIIMMAVLILYSSYIISEQYKENKKYQVKYEATILSKNLLMSDNSENSISSHIFRRKIYIKNELSSPITGYAVIPILFDENCKLKAFNSTIRVFDDEFNEMNFTFLDAEFCNNSSYIKHSLLAIPLGLEANETKYLYVYYSPEQFIKPADTYSSLTDLSDITYFLSFTIYPEEEIRTVSISKLMKINNLTYEEIKKLANYHDVYVEIVPE